VYSPTIGFGARTQPIEAYTEKPEAGVNLVTIQGAHTLDLVIALLGPFADLSALTTTQYPMIQIGDAVPQKRRTFDHLLVQARLANGAAASIEVIGAGGTLTLEGGAMRGFQAGRLSLSLNGKPDEAKTTGSGLAEGAANVAAIYANLRDDIAQGTRTVIGFPHAVRLARLVDAALISSQEGRRVAATDWPQD
jgi:predicted dehydrogenase